MNTSEFVTLAIIVMFSVATLLSVIRIVRGPTILDRMIASDVLLSTVILVLGADMVLRSHTQHIATMVALAATAAMASIVVAKFVRRRQALAELRSAEGERHV